MTEHLVNSVPVVNNSEPLLPFQLFETRPDSITYHWIWGHELEKLVNVARPVTLGLATLFAGAFLGLLPSIFEAFDKVDSGEPLGVWSLLLCMISALCLAAGAACTVFAYKGQSSVNALCEDVKTRNLMAVHPPAQQNGSDGMGTAF